MKTSDIVVSSETKNHRRHFLTATAVAGSSILISGCENGGVGNHPDNIDPSLSLPIPFLPAFGFSVDFYPDQTFRINADPRKVMLLGMYKLKAISKATLSAGQSIISLIDHLNGESFLMKIASGGIKQIQKTKYSTPKREIDLDITKLRQGTAQSRVAIETIGSDCDVQKIGGINFTSDLDGKWQGRLPNGSRATYAFKKIDSTSIAIRSQGISRIATFKFKKRNDDRKGFFVLDGQVRGVFNNDVKKRVRYTKMTLECQSSTSILWRTEFVEWNSKGIETRRRWWPSRLDRVG